MGMASDVSSSPPFHPKSGNHNHNHRANSRAPRCCVRCRNHGLKKLVRGHKRYCPYTLCPCRLCLATRERQVHMAKTIKRRRYYLQDLQMQPPNLNSHQHGHGPELSLKVPKPEVAVNPLVSPVYAKAPPEVTTVSPVVVPPVPGPVEPPRDTPPTSPVGSLPPPPNSHPKNGSIKSEASLPTSSPYSKFFQLQLTAYVPAVRRTA